MVCRIHHAINNPFIRRATVIFFASSIFKGGSPSSMASSVGEDSVSAPLTDYEKLRLENVKRNQAMIAALCIQNAKSQMHDIAGVAIRRSRRLAQVNHFMEEAHEIKCSTLDTEPVRRTLASSEDTKQAMSLAMVCVQGSSGDKLITELQCLEENVLLFSLPCSKSSSLGANIEPYKFTLQENDIARVVPERITSASFLPISEHLFLVAGDKGGHLGFWNVESKDPEGEVVCMYRPHTTPISGISFASYHATKVFTCSYDQTVKLMDVETSMFNLIYCSDRDEILSAICSAPGSPFCVYLAEGPGCLKMLDTREKRHSLCVDIHRMTINTIDLNLHSAWLMATSSTDRKVRVWDIRKLKGVRGWLSSIKHQGAVHSAQFSPSGKAIATCSYDNTVAFTKASYTAPRFIAHHNRHQRGMSSMRAVWGWDDRYVYVGNMKRSIDIISTKFEIECHWLSNPLMTSIPSRLAAHPLRPGILAGCSSTGDVYLWRQ